jgi:hypothetical protein
MIQKILKSCDENEYFFNNLQMGSMTPRVFIGSRYSSDRKALPNPSDAGLIEWNARQGEQNGFRDPDGGVAFTWDSKTK